MAIRNSQLIRIQVQANAAIKMLEEKNGLTLTDGARIVASTLVTESLVFGEADWAKRGISFESPDAIADQVAESLSRLVSKLHSTGVDGTTAVTANDLVAAIANSWCKVFPFCK